MASGLLNVSANVHFLALSIPGGEYVRFSPQNEFQGELYQFLFNGVSKLRLKDYHSSADFSSKNHQCLAAVVQRLSEVAHHHYNVERMQQVPHKIFTLM